jgi:putative ATP-binding cassette transporter
MSDTAIAIPRRAGFLRKLWALAKPYFWSEEKWRARLLLGAVILLTLAIVATGVAANYWYKYFYDALQTKNEARFWQLLAIFVGIAFPGIIVSVYKTYLQQMLEIRWRRWMTDQMLRRWLQNRNYYRMQLESAEADNPEQRIEQDVAFFTKAALDLSLGLLGAVVTLCSFITILWTISGPLTFTLGGMTIVIPGYMVFVAILYSATGSVLTYWIGKVLARINFRLERANASFRFGMTRLREHAESVAFYGGEETERRGLMMRFNSVWENWWQLMRNQKKLSWFINFYQQIAIIFPFIVAAPRYFSGAIDLGTLMQIGDAFGNVNNALSWFILNFTDQSASNLTAWKATIDRLTGFMESLERVDAQQSEIAVANTGGRALAIDNLAIEVPGGRRLIQRLSTRIEPGERLLVSGPSGSGKTTLFRALAGLWPYGSGSVQRPDGAQALFLPQRPYLPIGTLRQAIAYPAADAKHDDPALRAVLEDVGLPHLVNRIDEKANWSMALSIGEQQRLAVARALLLKPDWLYLDEATSALDAQNEQRMYRLISDRLPKTTVISIAHRPDVARYHGRRLAIDPDSQTATLTPLAAE